MNVYFTGMLVSMIAYIVIGLAVSRKVRNANDFYVAGRQAPTVLIVGSMVASYCSTGLFMGDAGEAYNGIFVPLLITVTMQVGGYVLGSVFFGKYLRRSEAITIPGFFRKRFQSPALGRLAALTALVTLIAYMLSVMQGIGTLMNYVTGVDYNLCILLALVTFTLVSVTSGSKGVLITDTIMFGIFTSAALVSVFVIAHRAGGWYSALESISMENPALLSYSGDLNYFYPSGMENMIWALSTGVIWLTVCMVGPWQSSRYLMAKNEHVVVRSSVFAALGVFLVEFFIAIGAVFVHKFHVSDIDGSHAMLWAATNILPVGLGVVMLTGVLAAGISSATTFLSLIGSTIANDLVDLKDDKKKVKIGKAAIVMSSMIVLILSYLNPPQIYLIMLLSGAIIACSWFPICVCSIWSKRVTKTGAFLGMLFGFVGCAAVKIYASVTNTTLPIYMDSFFVGFAANIIGLIIGTKFTKVSAEEEKERRQLFVVPKQEYDVREMKVTKVCTKLFIALGAVVTAILIIFWVLPYGKVV